jgi:hypothetical protein
MSGLKKRCALRSAMSRIRVFMVCIGTSHTRAEFLTMDVLRAPVFLRTPALSYDLYFMLHVEKKKYEKPQQSPTDS